MKRIRFLRWGSRISSTGSAVKLVSLKRQVPFGRRCESSFLMQLAARFRAQWKQAFGWKRSSAQCSYDPYSYSLNFDDGLSIPWLLTNSIGMFLNKLILSPSNVSPDASLPLQKPFCAHRNKILGVFLHHSNIILQLLYVVLLQYSCFFACWHLSSDRLYNIFELSCLFIPPGSFELSLSFSVKLCFQMLVQIMLHARVILYVPAGSSRP